MSAIVAFKKYCHISELRISFWVTLIFAQSESFDNFKPLERNGISLSVGLSKSLYLVIKDAWALSCFIFSNFAKYSSTKYTCLIS